MAAEDAKAELRDALAGLTSATAAGKGAARGALPAPARVTAVETATTMTTTTARAPPGGGPLGGGGSGMPPVE